eukprot:359416-Chlamydomonas_euryale.AAC.10
MSMVSPCPAQHPLDRTCGPARPSASTAREGLSRPPGLTSHLRHQFCWSLDLPQPGWPPDGIASGCCPFFSS